MKIEVDVPCYARALRTSARVFSIEDDPSLVGLQVLLSEETTRFSIEELFLAIKAIRDVKSIDFARMASTKRGQ